MIDDRNLMQVRAMSRFYGGTELSSTVSCGCGGSIDVVFHNAHALLFSAAGHDAARLVRL